MAITGGIKVFERSKNLSADGATANASSGDAANIRALDKNVYTFWRSVGSSDSVSETFEVTFPSTTTLDRLLLIDHNWKDFKVEYDVVGVWTAFANVIGLDGSIGGGVIETAFADNSSYYEFDSVSTDKILITINKTQVVDAEKFINQIVSTVELGTLEGFPNVRQVRPSRNMRVKRMLSGRVEVSKSEEIFRTVNLDFQDYPARLTDDIDLMFDLDDSEDDFLIWLCGGRRGTTYFTKEIKGFRLKDLIPMQTDRDIANTYSKNVYLNTIRMRVSLAEHV